MNPRRFPAAGPAAVVLHAACLAAVVLLAACSGSLPGEAEIAAAPPEALPAILSTLRGEQRADPEDAGLQILLARALLRAGKTDEAEPLALEAARRSPFDGTVMNLLGDIYLARNKRFRALTAYSQAIEFEPSLLTAYVSLGVVQQLLERPEEALRALREAVRREPGYYPAQYELGRVLFANGEADQAAEVVATARRIRPDALQAQLLEIRVAKAQGRLTVAALLVEQALRRRPGTLQLMRERLDIHVQRAEWNDALALLDRMARAGSLDIADELVRAEVLRAGGRTGEARRLLDELLRRAPRHPRVLLAGARAQIVRGNPSGALAALNGAVERDPQSVEAYYWKSIAHFQLGEHTQGDAALNVARGLAPGYPPARLLRARRLLAQRKLDEALPLLRAQLAANPGDGNALLVHAEALTLMGQYAAAERSLREIVPAASDGALRFARARLAYLRGAYRAVLEQTEPLWKRAATPWQLAYLHGAALLRLGRGGEATAVLRARTNRGEGGGELHRLLGDIYRLAGVRKEAERTYVDGLARFPRQPRLLESVSRLAVEDGRWRQARNWLEAGIERPSPQRPLLLERLSRVYRQLNQPGKARQMLELYLAATDPLLREQASPGEQHILFSTAFPAIGYGVQGRAAPSPGKP